MALVEMEIDSIRVSSLHKDFRPIILHSKKGERYLAIWEGLTEAEQISIKLQGITTPRPLTHDLFLSVIHVFGGNVDSIIISDLKGTTFYAKLILNIGEKKHEVDCRPCDALALAVTAGAPILAEEEVINKAAIPVGWKPS